METIELSKVLDLVAAPALLDAFLQKKGRSIRINAEQVQRVGAQCLQIILSAKRTWEADGCGFSLDDPSPAFTEAVKLVGLSIEDLTYNA